MNLVFFVEELSMKMALDQILPKLGLESHRYTLISHQGARDLERKLPKRLRAWQDPKAEFIILRDNDNGNCVDRKQRLLEICRQADRSERAHVRIVCQELESWFLGDPAAARRAGYSGDLKVKPHEDVDAIEKPSRRVLDRLTGYLKTEGASRISAELDLDANTSASLNSTVSLIRRLTDHG